MSRIEYVEEIEQLIRKDRNYSDVTLTYGVMTNDGFSERGQDANTERDVVECVLIKHNGRSPQFGIVQSIAMDSLFYILIDVLEGIKKL